MTLPTDKLYKFIAVGGITLFIFGATVPVSHYNDAELALIDAMDKQRRLAAAYSDYAEQVNKGITLYNQWATNPEKYNKSDIAEQIKVLMPEADKLDRIARENQIQFTKHIELMLHYDFMKKVWGAIGITCILTGIAGIFFGFRVWLRESSGLIDESKQ